MSLSGIVKDLPDADYRAAPGYGSTAIKWFLEEVPAQAKHWIDHPEDLPTFDAANVGTLVHALVLGQPHPYVVKDWDGRTKAGKERAEEAAAQGLVPMSADDFLLAKGCAEGVLKHPTARAILERPGSGAVFSFAFYVCLLAERRMLTTLFFLLSVACYVSFVPVGFAVALAGR